MTNWHDWLVLGVMTLVVSFGVTAGVIAMSANEPPTGYVPEQLLACEADLGKLRTAKAQIESRALVYLRDLTDARHLQAQCRAEAGHALPMLVTAQATVAAQKLEILRLKSAGLVTGSVGDTAKLKPPPPLKQRGAKAAQKRASAKSRANARPKPSS